VVFWCTAILIFTIYQRNAANRVFYKLYTISAGQNRLKQQLGKKQLELESLINPAAVLQHLSGE
jgi:hypothetical protein